MPAGFVLSTLAAWRRNLLIVSRPSARVVSSVHIFLLSSFLCAIFFEMKNFFAAQCPFYLLIATMARSEPKEGQVVREVRKSGAEREGRGRENSRNLQSQLWESFSARNEYEGRQHRAGQINTEEKQKQCARARAETRKNRLTFNLSFFHLFYQLLLFSGKKYPVLFRYFDIILKVHH